MQYVKLIRNLKTIHLVIKLEIRATVDISLLTFLNSFIKETYDDKV